MYGNQGVLRYRETDLGTMSRERMVVLLYEKMVSDLEEAVAAIESGDRALFTKRVTHSQRIVAELRQALDHKTGGEIAGNLDSIYDFLFREHLSLLLDREPRRAKACMDVLRPLLDAWRQIPNGTGENELRARVRNAGGAGADPANSPTGVRAGGEGNPVTASSPATPEPLPGRTGLLSVSA